MNKLEFAALPEKDRMNRVLEGTAFFASVHTPNLSAMKKFGALPEFVINLGLDDNGVKKAKEFGLKVLPADEFIKMPYVKLKRKVKPGKTPAEVKPQVVDTNQNDVPPNILIGNLSKVACKFGTYWYDTGAGGIGTVLFKVQVKELIPFEAVDKSGFVSDGSGFKVPESDDEPPFDITAGDGFKDPTEFDN